MIPSEIKIQILAKRVIYYGALGSKGLGLFQSFQAKCRFIFIIIRLLKVRQDGDCSHFNPGSDQGG